MHATSLLLLPRQDIFTNQEMKLGMQSSAGVKKIDFDEEARKLWERLGINPNETTSRFNHLDPIFKHPNGGCIYVGNQTAAADLKLLTSHGITHVVNCTSGGSKIPDFHKGKLNYIEFPITFWNQYCDSTDASVLRFAGDLFAFIDSALEGGKSVLVHCLAGAHRAGTTGCACLMHYADLPARSAIIMAKKCREIIDPIGMLPEFLMRLEKAKQNQVR